MYFDILKLIKQIQKNITCPICGRNFNLNEIKIKYILDEIAVLNLSCNNKHQPIQTIYVIILEKKKNSTTGKQGNFITNKNKKIINKQIEEFDGDFIKLWKK